MSKKTFKHGIHPAGEKHLSADQPIRLISAEGEMVYPLSQHIGAPATPLVSAGEQVLAGQKIAEAGGFVSAPVYSAVSGKVKGVAPHMTASGETAPCIIIENDGLHQWVDDRFRPDFPDRSVPGYVDALMSQEHVARLTSADIRNAIREAGLVGLGGAGFPTVVKLTPPDDGKIEYLIVNAAECEPYLTSDYRLMLERGEELLAGCELLLRLFPNAKCLIGVEDNKPAAIKSLTEKAGKYPKISVIPLKAKYPQGGERMLVYALTRRKLNSSLLPSGVGCVVVNVATTISVFRAVTLGQPLTHRIMTITGDAVASPCNLEVPIGMSYEQVMAQAGGFISDADPEKVITGGPMMGTALYTMEIPVTKTSASVLAYRFDPVAVDDPSACIHCGRCLSACPEHLLPQLLSDAAENEAFDQFEKYGGMECIECGSCAYVCPAKRHLVQSMRFGKRKTGALIRARKTAEAAKAAEKGGKDA
ncbi:MAG: electron transport complex subunit RsxC [Ruminococcaceae bacterium]|nr:electron transport complex subunit RsxC [Oscillospiraceae bacterium]